MFLTPTKYTVCACYIIRTIRPVCLYDSLNCDYLDDFFYAVVDDEYTEEDLACQHEEIHRRHVTDQLHRSKTIRRNGATSCRVLSHKSTQSIGITTEAYTKALYNIMIIIYI